MFSELVFTKRPVDVFFVVSNVNEVRIKRMKVVLFRESNFFAEKGLCCFSRPGLFFKIRRPLGSSC